MTVIAKNDASEAVWRAVFSSVAAHMQRCGAHPARTVVLVPYAQLMPLAQRLWGLWHPDGFSPRFETTRNWARRLGELAPEGDDLAQDPARDALTARALLERAGLADQRELLAGSLQEAANQLAPVLAAQPPAQRDAWAQRARPLLAAAADGGVLRYEAAVACIALEWAAASRFATDVLLHERARSEVDALVVLEGFQADPLAQTLQLLWGDRALALGLHTPASPLRGSIHLHEAADTEDEAQRAAACVLKRIAEGYTPVALAATDRALTRRIRALLDSQGVPVRDESGWTLSTTRAAAQAMASLRSCAWNASTDDVLDWLKHVPGASAADVAALEKWLRKAGQGTWSAASAMDWARWPAIGALVAQTEQWRQSLRSPRPLTAWLDSLRALLQTNGQWDGLSVDEAGTRVLGELRLVQDAQSDLHGLQSAARPMDLTEFTRWVNEVLEAARYVPTPSVDAPVVVLPLSQLLARPFAALVLPGCDEKRLQPSPEPPGEWTTAQRQALGLPTREALEAAQRAAWNSALQTPWVDLLWRSGDEGGEPLLASPLVLALQLEGQARSGCDHRSQRPIAPTPAARPQPTAQALPVQRLSSSAYSDLRHCPYRFFALRQLGLQEADELGAEIDKRDFGTWLHAVLQHFHESLQADPVESPTGRTQRLDASAQAITRAQRLDEGDFLPFAAGWPQVRDGYLNWLQKHEQSGATFRRAELEATQPLGPLTLVGKLDRIDTATEQGSEPVTLVIDYKTENETVTRQRIKNGGEDLQLSFYAALLSDDPIRAAYVNVGERGETQTFEQDDVVALRDQLLEGIQHDFDRIAAGAPLPALGEGAVCDYCAARGLCRKDFW